VDEIRGISVAIAEAPRPLPGDPMRIRAPRPRHLQTFFQGIDKTASIDSGFLVAAEVVNAMCITSLAHHYPNFSKSFLNLFVSHPFTPIRA
jgi:hypothetical protein